MSVQCNISKDMLAKADNLVKVFNLNLNENSTKISEYESVFANDGIDKVREHCEKLRQDVQAATNSRIEAINELNASHMNKINDYEKECLTIIGTKESMGLTKDKNLVSEIQAFDSKWRCYLNESELFTENIIEANDTLLELQSRLDAETRSLNDLAFGNKTVSFKKNRTPISQDFVGELNTIKMEKKLEDDLSPRVDEVLILKEKKLPSIENKILMGHSNYVMALVSVNDKLVASGSWDNTIKIWNIVSGNLIKTLQGHENYIYTLAMLENGCLASGSNDNTIKIWNLDSFELLRTLSDDVSVHSLISLGNGKLAGGYFDGAIRIWGHSNGHLIKKIDSHTRSVYALALLNDGTLASSSYDAAIHIWNVITGELIRSLNGHECSVGALIVLDDGLLAFGCFNNTIKMLNVVTGELVKILYGHTKSVESLALLSNGYLASGSGDLTIKLWNLETGEMVKSFDAHRGSIGTLTALANGGLASGSFDKTVRIWTNV